MVAGRGLSRQSGGSGGPGHDAFCEHYSNHIINSLTQRSKSAASDGEFVAAVTEGHEGTAKRVTVHGAGDFHEASRFEKGG